MHELQSDSHLQWLRLGLEELEGDLLPVLAVSATAIMQPLNLLKIRG